MLQQDSIRYIDIHTKRLKKAESKYRVNGDSRRDNYHFNIDHTQKHNLRKCNVKRHSNQIYVKKEKEREREFPLLGE